jgi:hypothetical protein
MHDQRLDPHPQAKYHEMSELNSAKTALQINDPLKTKASDHGTF